MSSPKINKIQVYTEEGPVRVYEWEDNKLTYAELTVFLNMINKMPKGSWLEE